ncbi:hypothetical protein KP77_16430 [Jeotgalibacillus alimentarius]|uniref:DUF4367 domain-containing protein n=1 Tax=Jeotgalibacillus alimentarius TaxID=135826 RepID=A0A0C2W2D2_9BACL|nr:hypothetical protein [Jeotgalibacillus alimentarius]KIL50268.1 hypothetical protein KP77_16430 [Jeotgalibacillus alimentarius]
MKKMMMYMLISMLAAFMAACGTENSSEDDTAGEQNAETVMPEETEEAATDVPVEESETDSEETVEEESTEEEAAEESTDDSAEAEEDAEENSEGESDMRLLEQQMTLTINGDESERTAFLQESEENNYSVYVAEGFSFTLEEPNVDQVYFDEDDSQFMRIHTYPKAESEQALIEDQMKGQADAIQGEAAAEWTPAEADNVITGYEAAVGENQFKTYLYELNDMFVRIEIHTQADSGLEDAFIQMAETIE